MNYLKEKIKYYRIFTEKMTFLVFSKNKGYEMNETTSKHPHGKHGEENIHSFDDTIRGENTEVVENFTEIEDIQCTQEPKVLKEIYKKIIRGATD